MPALYRTYRPQNFQQVIGQEIIKTTLQNAILNKKTVHSYLFSGPRGTGKTTMARIFAKALNCLHPDSAEPCNQCTNCQSINQNSFIDLVEIDAASNRGIDEIRSLKEAIRFAPSQKDGYKIYIIDEAHMLTKDASNALLKTLEEPPHNTIFILATTDAHKMLPTILSRVQKFDFKPLSNAELSQKIKFIAKEEKINIDEYVIKQIILQAMGGARDAESILGKLIAGGNKEITKDFAALILGKNSYFEAYQLLELLSEPDNIFKSIQYIHKLYDEGYAVNQLIFNLLTILHYIFLFQINPKLVDSNQLLDTEYEHLESLAKSISQSKIIALIQALEIIKSQTNTAYLPYLPLELSIAKIWSEALDIDSKPIQTKSHSPKSKSNTSTPPPSITPSSQPQEPTPAPSTDTIVQEAKIEYQVETKVEPSTQELNSNPNLSNNDISNIHKLYPSITKSLNKTNKSLAAILSQTQPIEVTKQILIIAVESDFYKARLEKFTNLILEAINLHLSDIRELKFTTQKIAPTQTLATPFDTLDSDQPKDINDTIADIFKDSF